MKKMCKDCLHYRFCINRNDWPITDKTLGCDLWEKDIRVALKGCIDLEDTVTMMISDDYKERFKAEYWQTKTRYERLKAFNNKIEAEDRMRCDPMYNAVNIPYVKHDTPFILLRDQQGIMEEYLHILEVRAVIEGIDFKEVDG